MKITRFLLLMNCLYLSTNYVYSQSEHVECNNAQFLCDKNPLFIPYLSAKENTPISLSGTCFQPDFKETNTIWFKWLVAQSGDLSFTILPIVDSDDIDFVVYRLNSFDNCTDKEVVRCMAAGPNLGKDVKQNLLCTGATGLRVAATQNDQSSGCPDNGSNFLRPIEVQSGESYALFINNFHSSKGIQLEWGGSATFEKVLAFCVPQSEDSSTILHSSNGTIKLSEPYPNPSTQTVNIQAESGIDQSGQLWVISSEGYIEKKQSFHLPAGNSILEINANDFRPGIYFIRLKTNDEVYALRFVKH